MTVQRVALVFGVVFLLVGILGLLTPGGTTMEADMETAPRLLNLFPVNLLHNLVHLAFGVWGLAASRRWGSARTYCRLGGILYLVLAGLGFVAADTFGLIPIGGNDIWLHLVLGLALVFFGFTARPAPDS
ncbi:MAG TPA: DUF4383 domain-containing protein [Longimicrobiaceae bacterium]|nr:DUF4383 domain-containing protein [Longimicrobiaceae bacterium]